MIPWKPEDYRDTAEVTRKAYDTLEDLLSEATIWLLEQGVEIDFHNEIEVAEALDKHGYYSITGHDYLILRDALKSLEGIAGRNYFRSRR